METYIGVKKVMATPMTMNAFREQKGTPPTDPDQEGYLVIYPDGYQSWCPKEIFEKANLGLHPAPKVMITQGDVDDFIKERHVSTIEGKTALVRVVLRNGFVITESSSVVDPENYDEDYGVELCMDRIEEKVWGYLGFLLCCACNGMDGGHNALSKS